MVLGNGVSFVAGHLVLRRLFGGVQEQMSRCVSRKGPNSSWVSANAPPLNITDSVALLIRQQRESEAPCLVSENFTQPGKNRPKCLFGVLK